MTSQIVNGLVHGHLGPQARKARAHQAASGVLCIGEQPLNFSAKCLVNQCEHGCPLVFWIFLNYVCRVIRGQQVKPQSTLRLGHRAKHQGLIVGRQSQKEIVSRLAIERQEAFETFFRGEDGPSIAKFVDGERSFRVESWRHRNSEAHGVARGFPVCLTLRTRVIGGRWRRRKH